MDSTILACPASDHLDSERTDTILACPASDHLDSERTDTTLSQHDAYEALMTELGFERGWSE